MDMTAETLETAWGWIHDPAARGAGVSEALLARLDVITADDNYHARALYDRVAVKTG